tara:strand:+ start:3091 stop:4422 length:1332 start_codon:yes stop_codon:yes gene_type:complete
MPTYVNDNGTWREVNESLNVNDNGTNREIDEAYVNDNGTWRLVYESEKPMLLSTSFKIGGYKFGPSGGSGTDNVTRAGYNNGELFLLGAGLLTGYAYGRFSTAFTLLSTASQWQEVQTANKTEGLNNSSFQNTAVGTAPNQTFYIVNGATYPNYRLNQLDPARSPNDPFTGNPPTGGSITTATYNTASTANGTTNTQGASHTIKQIFTGGQSSREDYNRIYTVIDAAFSSTAFPGQIITLTTPSYFIGLTEIPGDTFSANFAVNDSTNPIPVQTNIGSAIKAVRTPAYLLSKDGNRVNNLYPALFGQTFSGTVFVRSPQIEIYDRVNLPFKSSSGGVEYRQVLALTWQYEEHQQTNGTPATNPQILFAVEGHGLPANAWRRMEINGVSFDVSLFTKSENPANNGSGGTRLTPASTFWSYTYTGANSITAFGTIGSTISVNIYK